MDVRSLFNGFSTYLSVGLVNTLIHGVVFFVLYGLMNVRQALSNFGSYGVAATFSFCANARYTFKSQVSLKQYLLFVGFMGGASFGIGWLGDWLVLPGVAVPIVFLGISLVGGFFYSKYFVFRECNS